MKRIHFDKSLLTFHSRRSVVPGSQCLIATHPTTPVPVGHLWYDQVLLGLVNIQHMYVYEYFRRGGIATAMLAELQEWYPDLTICTAVGNELSTPWLLKNGFIHEANGWFLRPAEPCPLL